MAWGDFETAVGKEVGVVRRNRSWGGISFSTFGTVTKINGHGHIFVKSGDRNFVSLGEAMHTKIIGARTCATQNNSVLSLAEKKSVKLLTLLLVNLSRK